MQEEQDRSGGNRMAAWEENVRKVVPYTPGEQTGQ